MGGLAGPAHCLKFGLGDLLFLKFAIENQLDGFLGLPQFLLLLGEAGVGDGAVGVATFLQALSPVLVRAAAEAMLLEELALVETGTQA